MKKRILSCCLTMLLLLGCAGTEENKNAVLDGTASSARAGQGGSAEMSAATSETTPDSAANSLSAEITLQILDAPKGLSDGKVWEKTLAPFYETYPDVRVRVVFPDVLPADGDAQGGADAEKTPDVPAAVTFSPGLILARPEQLLAGGAANEALEDLTTRYTPEAFSALLPNAVTACLADDGHYYAYPFAVSVSCMAVNRRMLEEAGALHYLDEENRSWNTEDFLLAVQALYDAGHDTVLTVPCAEGDPADATRSFLLSLYGGSFATPAFTGYEVRSENNLITFETLTEQEGVVFAPELTEADAKTAFLAGEIPMVTCRDFADALSAEERGDTDVLTMGFPVPAGAVSLPGELYCLAVSAEGTQEQQEAATALLDYLTALPFPAKDVLLADGFFPAIRNLRGLYEEESETARTFALRFVPHFAFYDRFTPDYDQAANAWNRMLGDIALGAEVGEALKHFDPGP